MYSVLVRYKKCIVSNFCNRVKPNNQRYHGRTCRGSASLAGMVVTEAKMS